LIHFTVSTRTYQGWNRTFSYFVPRGGRRLNEHPSDSCRSGEFGGGSRWAALWSGLGRV